MFDFKLRRLGFLFLLVMNLYTASPFNPTSHIAEISVSEIMAKLQKA
ncbi:MAG: hypothetical protein NT088_00810 [Candidatus Omnitrophica bacterium]|nr:hypothetical protein [Candidatus Omnitrophota bacterium]